MDIDTSRSMSSEAAKYLRYAKQCAKAPEPVSYTHLTLPTN